MGVTLTGFIELENALNQFDLIKVAKLAITRWLKDVVIPKARQTTSFNNRTGLLRSSIGFIDVKEHADGLHIITGWGPEPYYGKFIEFGTIRIRPRRFMTDSIRDEIASLNGYWVIEFASERHATHL